ncbi:hypothetical protein DUI87_03096 [Hirundo rustica rustica]|uniref:ribonuclease H n=1 Tax=Hirundo rustica rustica TaxID=333673 RepID=A0A3M0L1X6_HIRRU|nr:hypothetical protein DUI87_03096 [Hirundo rustica rustica]
MLRESISPVVASLAPAGGKPSPYPDKGESDGAAMEPTDVTTIQVPAEPQGQPQTAAVAPVETKKYKVKSSNPGNKDKKGGPSQPAGEPEVEIITESLTYESLCNLQNDLARQGCEAYTTWLLRVWDLIGTGVQLDSSEARNLGPLTQDSGVNQVEEQQVPIATSTVHRRQYRTNRDAVIPIHKMIRELESQGVVSKTHSPFNSPIWPVRKSDGEWRLTVDYHALNKVTPPLSAAMLDMLKLQYELESKAAKWYATIDITNTFFPIPLAAECRSQFVFTWRGVQYTWNRLPQEWKHSPTICHGLIQTALEKGEAPEHLQYINDIIV